MHLYIMVRLIIMTQSLINHILEQMSSIARDTIYLHFFQYIEDYFI